MSPLLIAGLLTTIVCIFGISGVLYQRKRGTNQLASVSTGPRVNLKLNNRELLVRLTMKLIALATRVGVYKRTLAWFCGMQASLGDHYARHVAYVRRQRPMLLGA